MNNLYHTSAPEKVRTAEAAAPASSHHGLLRNVLYLGGILILCVLLVLGILTPKKAPAAADEPAAPPAEEQTSGGLQPLTEMAADSGAYGAEAPGALEIVARFGEHELTNQTFVYYYWDSFYSLYNYYGNYMASMLDLHKPFDAQPATEDQTWHEYLTQMAVESWYQTEVLCDRAEAENFQPSQESLDHVEEGMAALDTHAANSGYANAEEYLHFLFDPCADLNSYRLYNERTMLAGDYSSEIYDGFYEESFDPEAEILHNVHVRHILVTPEKENDEESMKAAKAKAEELYAEWQKNPTEDNFAAMALVHTGDPGSRQNGGLYEDVYPGQMVPTFDEWCFADGRKTGDSGIVESPYGYHIMYFVSESETVYSDPSAELAQGKYTDWLDDLFSERNFDVFSDKVLFTEKK